MTTSTGYYTSEHHSDEPYIRECDNIHCRETGTLDEEWHDGSKWIKGKMWLNLNPMICPKCKAEFEGQDKEEEKEKEYELKLELSLTENN